MRAPLVLSVLVVLSACGSQAADQSVTHAQPQQDTTHPVAAEPAGPPLWVHTDRSVICVIASRTQDETPSGDPLLPGCKGWPDRDLAIDYVQGHSWCGPCGFFFDAAASTAERATRADACCYRVQSPPEPFGPPPPPPPAAGGS